MKDYDFKPSPSIGKFEGYPDNYTKKRKVEKAFDITMYITVALIVIAAVLYFAFSIDITIVPSIMCVVLAAMMCKLAFLHDHLKGKGMFIPIIILLLAIFALIKSVFDLFIV